jgi:hypothetical protein
LIIRALSNFFDELPLKLSLIFFPGNAVFKGANGTFARDIHGIII